MASGPTTHRIANVADPPQPLGGFAVTLTILLSIVAVLYFVAFFIELAYLDAANKYLGGDGSLTDVEDLGAGRAGFQLITGLVHAVAAGFFIAWMYRAYRNLQRTSVVGLRYDAGWAIGAWFIPIFNWIRPKQMIDDVWRAGESGVEVRDASWRERHASPLLHWWWALFIGGSILFAIGTVVGFNVDAAIEGRVNYADERDAATVFAPAMLCLVGAAILACIVIRRITERDDAVRAAVFAQPPTEHALAAASGPPPPPPPPSAPPLPPVGQAPQPPPPPAWPRQPPVAQQPPPPTGQPQVAPPPVPPPPPSGEPVQVIDDGSLIASGEKDIRCAACGWRFRDIRVARRHLEIHHRKERR
jgi:hypothetical protein